MRREPAAVSLGDGGLARQAFLRAAPDGAAENRGPVRRRDYLAGYRFLGFQGLRASYRRGATILVKFTLANASGTAIPNADAQALLTPCRVKIFFDDVDQPGCATYRNGSFQYNLRTWRSLGVGTHALGIKVSAPDGSGIVNTDATTVTITN